jgi:hypothetical protein
MQKRKQSVGYRYEDLPEGGAVRIETKDTPSRVEPWTRATIRCRLWRPGHQHGSRHGDAIACFLAIRPATMPSQAAPVTSSAADAGSGTGAWEGVERM